MEWPYAWVLECVGTLANSSGRYSMHVSGIGTTRTQDKSYPGQLVPMTTRTQDNSYPGQLVPKTTRTHNPMLVMSVVS